MWSLSFHPNIIKLTGYADRPRAIITPLYKTDLFRFLHMPQEKPQLESGLMLHFCAGIAAGLDAIHSMGIAHRDIKSSNVLLDDPRAGSGERYPRAVICDFGISRTGDDTASVKKSALIKGFSPRYAAPEVFARAHMRRGQSTADDDKRADVYSLGVTLWEIFARRIPWDGLSNDKIELKVRAAGRLDELFGNEKDEVHVLVVATMNDCLLSSAIKRPTIGSINNKFVDLVQIRMGIMSDLASAPPVRSSTTATARSPPPPSSSSRAPAPAVANTLGDVTIEYTSFANPSLDTVFADSH